jgi:hypothetical protein
VLQIYARKRILLTAQHAAGKTLQYCCQYADKNVGT